MKKGSVLLMVLLWSVLFVCQAHSAYFMGLGDLPGGIAGGVDSFHSSAFGVSADGTTVVGESNSSNGNEAFRWTKSSGMVGMGDLTGGTFDSIGFGASANGSIVVGPGHSTNGAEAFRWTQSSGMVGLGDLTGGSFYSYARGISADGSTIVGTSNSTNGDEAFRWTQSSGMVGLGYIAGGSSFSVARGVSIDGSVVVGNSYSSNGNEAFRWTQSGGMVGIGDLTGGGFYSLASAVSADGSVVVGNSTSANGGEAFRWTQSGGMVGLGDLAGGDFSSSAHAVSADGSRVVGGSRSANGTEVFLWSEADGMENFKDVLEDDYGLDLTGWTLVDAKGISADGSVIVGVGTNPDGYSEAWIANLRQQIAIDIIPKTCPNECPIKGGGSVEVAILGTVDLDVNDVDIASIRLEGVAPSRSSLKDKSTPDGSPTVCDCTTDGKDGSIDLCLKFDKKAIITAIETALGGVVDLDIEYPLTLTGNKNDGTPIEGEDCITFVKKGKKN